MSSILGMYGVVLFFQICKIDSVIKDSEEVESVEFAGTHYRQGIEAIKYRSEKCIELELKGEDIFSQFFVFFC